MATMHSELLAVTAQGQLCQWRWCDAEPYYCAEVNSSTLKYTVLKRYRAICAIYSFEETKVGYIISI